MYKTYFSKFLNNTKGILHFAAHSHHFWPDVTYEAHKQYWLDSSAMVDDKWDHIFGNVINEVQNNIAFACGFSNPEMIAIAPNTHELIVRLLSCFDLNNGFKVLTSDSEFHSFSRQISRLEEKPGVQAERVPAMPFDTFSERFIHALEHDTYDLVFLSRVFFNSGFYVKDIERIINKIPSKTTIIIDGYHAFFALDQNLKAVEDRIFFLGGGYKYSMSGEGVCFMHVPKSCTLRPENTGWFAGFSELSSKEEGRTGFSNDGFRFWGSTFDASGLYRFNSVCKWMKDNDFTITKFREYVVKLQELFINELKTTNSKVLNLINLISSFDNSERGNFLTFQLANAGEISNKLREHNVISDFRNDRLRFGFAIYHDEDDINKLIKIIRTLEV